MNRVAFTFTATILPSLVFGVTCHANAFLQPPPDQDAVIEPIADPLGKQPNATPSGSDGDWSVDVSGELKQWHKVTLTMAGPFADEQDQDPNPFTDFRMTVFAEHESGWPKYSIPGYFAADGNAGQTSAQSGNKWRAHLSPDKAGTWKYSILFEKSRGVIYLTPNGKSIARGEFQVAASDKTGRDFRGKGRLQYVRKHYLQFAGNKKYFLKAGTDSPETCLLYTSDAADE